MVVVVVVVPVENVVGVVVDEEDAFFDVPGVEHRVDMGFVIEVDKRQFDRVTVVVGSVVKLPLIVVFENNKNGVPIVDGVSNEVVGVVHDFDKSNFDNKIVVEMVVVEEDNLDDGYNIQHEETVLEKVRVEEQVGVALVEQGMMMVGPLLELDNNVAQDVDWTRFEGPC